MCAVSDSFLLRWINVAPYRYYFVLQFLNVVQLLLEPAMAIAYEGHGQKSGGLQGRML
jgi:hypothetical protein